jgi:hypothetical protein
MLKQLELWLQTRPTTDELMFAMDEASELAQFYKNHGMSPAIENVEKVLKWVFIANQLPIDWLEMKIKEELYGKKR